MLRAVEALLLPPTSPLLLFALGWLLGRKLPRLGRAARGLALLLLVVTAMPIAGSACLITLQPHAALDLDRLPSGPQAIVVLSADMDVAAPEYGHQTVGPMTMQRIRYAAALHRKSKLPVLVSGGMLAGHDETHAASMHAVLEGELSASVRWREDQSRTTAENARFSAEVLRGAGVERVFLVTHAWHMPRALQSFARHGITCVPAPTAFAAWPTDPWVAGLPRWSGVRDVSLALHEWLGHLYYRLTER